MHILPQEKIGMYLAEAERRGLLAAFYLELTTGLRKGELLALLWTDLDVDSRTISVTKQVNRINGELVVSLQKTQILKRPAGSWRHNLPDAPGRGRLSEPCKPGCNHKRQSLLHATYLENLQNIAGASLLQRIRKNI